MLRTKLLRLKKSRILVLEVRVAIGSRSVDDVTPVSDWKSPDGPRSSQGFCSNQEQAYFAFACVYKPQKKIAIFKCNLLLKCTLKKLRITSYEYDQKYKYGE